MDAREQARERAEDLLNGVMRDGPAIQWSHIEGAADAASDVWEPIAKTLRRHIPTPVGHGYACVACGGDSPCPEWTKASEALDD